MPVHGVRLGVLLCACDHMGPACSQWCDLLVELNSCILWPFAACGKAGIKEPAVGTPLVCVAKSSASHNQRRF